MVLIETPEKAAAVGVLSIERTSFRFLGAAYFLTRPILMGILALLFSILCCRAYGETSSTRYPMPPYAPATPVLAQSINHQPKATRHADAGGVPLLFLSFIGLAGMALSRTGTSREARS